MPDLEDFTISPLSRKIVWAKLSEIDAQIGGLHEIEKSIFTLGIEWIQNGNPQNNESKKLLHGMIDYEKNAESLPTPIKFALDRDQIQIARKHGPESFQRCGILRNPNGTFEVRNEHESVYEAEEIDLQHLAPNIAAFVNDSHQKGTLVLAVLGAARLSGEKTQAVLETASLAVGCIAHARNNNIAVMTGGYKGEFDNKYGATRAGHDVAVSMKLPSLVVMPKAGEKDSHVNVDEKDIVGDMWGDDTKALISSIDAAVVIKPYGLWTEIEIANLQKQKKPFCVVDADAKEVDVLRKIGELIAHPSLTHEKLMERHDPSASEWNRHCVKTKRSAQFNHSQQRWMPDQRRLSSPSPERGGR